MWTSVKWGSVVMLFTVTLTWTHVVVDFMVPIVETGTSLMEIECHSLIIIILLLYLRLVQFRELIFVVPLLLNQMVSIVVILKLMLSMVMI